MFDDYYAAEESDDPRFDEALNRFVESVQAMVQDHLQQNYPNAARLGLPVFYAEHGPRYVRIVKHEGPLDAPISRSVYAFVERATGDILKADGWKRPAKHARGSIYGENPLTGMGPHGPHYLREGAREGAREEASERGESPDEQNVHELVLFVVNDGDLYRSQTTSIMRNLAKRMLKGTYDPRRAPELWRYLADAGAQKYTREIGGGGPHRSYGMFSPADRDAAALEFARKFESEVKNGEHNLEDLARGR